MPTAEKLHKKQPNQKPQTSEQSFFARSSGHEKDRGESFFSTDMVQAKLSVGKPDDQYEREADAMARRVVTGLGSTKEEPQNEKKSANPEVQKVEEEEEMAAQTKVRRKTEFTTGIGDEEDDDQDMGQSAGEFADVSVQEKSENHSDTNNGDDAGENNPNHGFGHSLKTIAAKFLPGFITPHQNSTQPTTDNPTPEVQANGRTYGLPQPGLETRLDQNSGKGESMPENTREEMEGAFGADFEGVRIHTDDDAVDMSSELNAKAFTHRNDIYFNEGQFNPDQPEGKELLAHELTHTLQQGASVQRKPDIQKEEELDLAQMLRDLIESNKEQREALDPSEANQTRKEAGEEAEKAEQQANAEIPEVVSAEPEALPEAEDSDGARIAEPVKKKPDIVTPNQKPVSQDSGKNNPSSKVSVPETPVVEESEETPVVEPPAVENAEPIENGAGGGSGEDAGTGDEGGDEKGPVGQLLDQESEGVCNKAAAKAQNLADNESAHDTAEEKSAQTEVAVEPPEEEGQSRSNAEQVNTLEDAETPEANPDDTKREMEEAISEAVPSKIKELNEFESEKKAQVIGNKVLADTSKQVGEVQGTYNEIETAPPAAESETPVALPSIEQAPETPALNLGKDAVPDVPQEQTDLSNFEEEADGIYEKEGISPDMQSEFDKVDSGDLAEANKEKGVLKDKVQNEPANLQQFSQDQKKGVEKDLRNEEDRAKGEMQKKREGELEGARDKQEKTKTEMEKKREAVTTWINDRYQQAKDLVTEKLSKLEEQALARFDVGQKQLSVRFEQNVKRRVNRWKDKRYSGFWGAAKWIKDKFVGIDHFPEIKEIFSSERKTFVDGVDRLIVDINRENEKTIQACKDELAKAKTDIQEYIDNLGPELKDVGQKAQEETNKKLAELDAHIEAEKKKLQQKLCDKKEEAIKAIDKKIEQMKSEMSGIVGKLKALLLYAAKKFFKWAIGKIGGNADKIISLLDKGATVLKKLFTDPINFFKNLVKAIGGGVNRFVTNIVTWLKKGLMSWLLGQMGDSGLELPQKFDLKGILFLGLQVAGLTWNVIRTRLVKKLGSKGETIVGTAEKSMGIIQRVIKEGPIALWHIIVEKAGEIKEKVLEGIRNWAITKIVQKAVTKILTMLNPAGAIVQAIIMLYDVVMFFIENWDRIIDFVNSVFDSIGAIASGAIGQAAAFIEQTLGKAVPMMLSFFARFVGLDGIGKAVKKVIEAIQRPFKKILDKIIGFLVKQVKKLVKKVKKFGSKVIRGGKSLAKSVKDKLLNWLGIKKPFKSKDGGNHKVYLKKRGKLPVIFVASDPAPVEAFLKDKATKEKDGVRKQEISSALKFYQTEVNAQILEVSEKERVYSTTTDKKPKRAARYAYTEAVKKLELIMQTFANKYLSPLNFENESDLTIITEINFKKDNGKAKEVKAWPLTYLPGKYTGSPPGTDPPGFDYVRKAKSKWVRGHLLSESLHGPGAKWNLIPISQSSNSKMESIEAKVKPLIKKQGSLLFYQTNVTYDENQSDPLNKIPISIHIYWGTLEAIRNDSGDISSYKTTSENREPSINQGFPIISGPPNLNSLGRIDIVNYSDKEIKERMAVDIVACRDKFVETGGEFDNFSDLISSLKKYYADELTLKSGMSNTKRLSATNFPSIQIILNKVIAIDKKMKIE